MERAVPDNPAHPEEMLLEEFLKPMELTQRQHSIRINEQYRVCFRWEDGYADEVEVIDYH